MTISKSNSHAEYVRSFAAEVKESFEDTSFFLSNVSGFAWLSTFGCPFGASRADAGENARGDLEQVRSRLSLSMKRGGERY